MYDEMTKETRANVKELLNENKATFKLLNFNKGYDFEKPFMIIKGKGKFTYNSIIKLIKNNIDDFDIKDYNCFIVGTDIRTYHKGIYGIVIDNEGLDNIYKDFYYTKSEWISNPIRVFYKKKDLDAYRKGFANNYYVIIQKDVYTNYPMVTRLDLTERVKFIKKDYDYVTLSQNNFVSNERHYSSYIIDKSGYVLNDIRHNYQNRVNEVKANKNKTIADNTDVSNDIAEITKSFEEIKNFIASNIFTDDVNRLFKVRDIINQYATAYDRFNSFLDYYTNKKFKSVDTLVNSLATIKLKIEAINSNIVTMR